MTDIDYMDPDEFQRFGYLQELNRRFLHPLGLALEMRYDEGRFVGFEGIWDYRADREGMFFADGALDGEKFDRVQRAWHDRKRDRVVRLGYMVQPVSERVEYAGLTVLLALALKNEFTYMEGSDESWRKIARGVLDKITNAVIEERFEPGDVKPEEIDLLDLVLMSTADPSLTRIEAVNTLIDDRNEWKAKADEAIFILRSILGYCEDNPNVLHLNRIKVLTEGVLDRIDNGENDAVSS